MTNSSSERPGEFELIAKLFAPLSAKSAGAYGLTDDAATFQPPAGEDIVVTADLLTAGIHFRAEDPPGLIAKKALRVNLSDLAAKGAAPAGYLLSLALPRHWTLPWMRSFADGLHEDQDAFSVVLFGGDTTSTTGPLTIAVTALGTLPSGTMMRRNGAKIGDSVFVSGTIGDAGAGLAVLNGEHASIAAGDRKTLTSRYQLPTPRLALGKALRGTATASLDVSDGLLADLGHIAETSKVRIVVEADRIPLSGAWKEFGAPLLSAVTAGDDYEIAFTVPSAKRHEVLQLAHRAGAVITEIGRVETGSGVALLDSSGGEIPVSRKGYRHF
ncbi:MAG: thiamine-phosphate kinase [Proteobacteria bacterium]|nr:thiamine-phosphate kinase [Pseudomonadota bacterium]